MADTPKCSEESYHSDVGGGWLPCTRNGKITRDGKHYCWQHDPIAVRLRAEKQRAKWKEDSDKISEVYARHVAERSACAGIPTEVLESGLIQKLYEQHQSAGRLPLQVRSVVAGGTKGMKKGE